MTTKTMQPWKPDHLADQPGRVAIVTGANSGIGYETALALAKKDITVVLACRKLQKAEAARSSMLRHYPEARVEPMQVDVASLSDVRKFADRFHSDFNRLDLLINNAGIMMSPHQVTEDGFENQLATNYIGHFALSGLLMPLLSATAGSRVVTLSSLSYKWAEIDFDDLHLKKGYDKKKAYGQSKRACLVFAYDLQRRLSEAGHGTLSLAAHPGLSKTNLDRYFPKLIRPLGALFLQSASKGALPVLYAALEENLTGGEFIGPRGFQEMRGYPTIVDSDKNSKDREIADRLWAESEAMTGISYLSGNMTEHGDTSR